MPACVEKVYTRRYRRGHPLALREGEDHPHTRIESGQALPYPIDSPKRDVHQPLPVRPGHTPRTRFADTPFNSLLREGEV